MTDFSNHAICSALPSDGSAPEWVTIFPRLGKVETRDGRAPYVVDADVLIAAFKADGVDLPIDLNHATDKEGAVDAPAQGWVSELAVRDGALMGRVDWNDDGRAALAAKKYRYTSPSFFHTKDRRATRLKALALVTSPALGGQPALASLTQEPSMKSIASALGLSDDANETSCLSALRARLDASVPKSVHDETLARLSTVSAELAGLKDANRKAEIDALLDGALKDKKIVPAQRAHYEALCATDDGLSGVKALLGATTAALAGSGLDARKTPEGDGVLTAVQLAAQARKLVDAGEASCIADAVTLLEMRAAQ